MYMYLLHYTQNNELLTVIYFQEMSYSFVRVHFDS